MIPVVAGVGAGLFTAIGGQISDQKRQKQIAKAASRNYLSRVAAIRRGASSRQQQLGFEIARAYGMVANTTAEANVSSGSVSASDVRISLQAQGILNSNAINANAASGMAEARNELDSVFSGFGNNILEHVVQGVQTGLSVYSGLSNLFSGGVDEELTADDLRKKPIDKNPVNWYDKDVGL